MVYILITFIMQESRLTFQRIRENETSNLVKVWKKSADKRKVLSRLMVDTTSLIFLDEIILFLTTGLIPHAAVIRSQRLKLERVFVANFTLFQLKFIGTDEINELWINLDHVYEIYPYLRDQRLLNKCFHTVLMNP